MNTPRNPHLPFSSPLTLVAGAVLGLLLAGCETTGGAIDARINEKPAVFAGLEPWHQRDVRSGVVNVDDTPDIVYLAVGHPSRTISSADGRDVFWIYKNYYPANVVSTPSVHLRTEGGANYSPRVVSANAPRNGDSLSKTGIRGTAQVSLDVPDLPPDTLYIAFRDGKVRIVELESERQKQ